MKKDDKKLAAESAAGGDDLCNAIVGARYESVKLEECGPPVNGQPAPMCPSEIKFENGEYHWRVTDMVFFGPYSCKGDTIKGSGSGDLVARIGAKAATLTIKGELYKRK